MDFTNMTPYFTFDNNKKRVKIFREITDLQYFIAYKNTVRSLESFPFERFHGIIIFSVGPDILMILNWICVESKNFILPMRKYYIILKKKCNKKFLLIVKKFY